MKIYDFKNKIDNNELKDIIDSLNKGNLVIFPTETVYGIGADAFNESAINKIFIAKERAKDNPLIVHVSDYEMIKNCTKCISLLEKKLIDAFMPGPFTLILPKSDKISYNVTANLDTVGIRMPNNLIATKIIKTFGKPIAAPSANISTKPSGTNIQDIKDEFKNTVNIIIDGGDTAIGLESTVVKIIDGVPTILRPGKITKEDIIKVIGKCEYSKNINEVINGNVESPGLKYKHYAPNTKAVLVYNEDSNKQITIINKNLTDNTIVLGFKEHKKDIKSKYFISLGSMNNYDEISHNIFSSLRKADTFNADLIIIEGVSKKGIGIAIMNRLIKSCNHNYIEN